MFKPNNEFNNTQRSFIEIHWNEFSSVFIKNMNKIINFSRGKNIQAEKYRWHKQKAALWLVWTDWDRGPGFLFSWLLLTVNMSALWVDELEGNWMVAQTGDESVIRWVLLGVPGVSQTSVAHWCSIQHQWNYFPLMPAASFMAQRKYIVHCSALTL